MSASEKLKNVFVKIGENNKATYAAIAIAVAKGIFRPTFTMLDKKEDPKTKKYTALREGFTEVLAVPIYWGCGVLADKIAPKIQKDPAKLKITQTNLGFIALSIATLIVVPGLCSCLVKPFTNMLFKKDDSKATSKPKDENKKLDIIEGNNYSPEIGNIKVPVIPEMNKYYYSPYSNENIVANSGMRVR